MLVCSVPAPLFITWLQCVYSVLLMCFLGWLSTISPTFKSLEMFRVPRVIPDVMYKVATLSALFVGMITFNNMCLMHVEVSFYNVAKALSVVFNVIISYLVLGNTVSMRLAVTLVLVCLGA